MAKFCTGCGKEMPEGMAFCTQCGTKVQDAMQVKEEKQQPIAVEEQKAPEPAPTNAAPPIQTPPPQTQHVPQPAPHNTYQEPPQQPYQPPAQPREITAEMVKGTKYEPISTWGFIGIMLLMCIPVVGFILTIVWACGGCRKISKRSIARATLIMALIGIIIGLILTLVGGALLNAFVDKIELEANHNGGVFSGTLMDGGNEGNREDSLGPLAGILGGGEATDGSLDYENLEELLNELSNHGL